MPIPSDIAGLESWYDADDAASISIVDGLVDSWNDKSGNNRPLTSPSTGQKPVRVTNVVSGRAVVRYNPANTQTQNTAASFLSDQTRTFFIVAKSNQPNRKVMAFLSDQSHIVHDGGGQWLYANNQAGSGVLLGGSATSFQAVCVRYNSLTSADAFVNTNSATNFDPNNNYQGTSLDIVLGSHVNQTQDFMDGDIAEVIVYNSALSESDRQTIRTYLGAKYQLFPVPPSAVTTAATAIATTSATLNGTINPNGAATTYHFEYGSTISYGSTTSPDGNAGSGLVSVAATFNLTGLYPGQTIHYRLVATNPSGTVFGADQVFTTTFPSGPTQVNWTAVTNYDVSASYLLFPAVGGFPTVLIPLYIQEHNIPVRKARLTEINTIEMTNTVGWDTSFSAIFEGAPEPLQAVISGVFHTPTVQVADNFGFTYKRWAPTDNGLSTGVDLGLQGWSYGDLIAAYIEGRMNVSNNRWIRTDPSIYVDPFGHTYSQPTIFEFSCQNQAPPTKQLFSMTLILGL